MTTLNKEKQTAVLEHLTNQRDSALDDAEILIRTQDNVDPYNRRAEIDITLRDAVALSETAEKISRVHVRSEPLTYGRGGPHSFFVDSIRQNGDGAAKRLERHEEEMRVEYRSREFQRQRQLSRQLQERGIEANFELRAGSTTLGAGGNFTPPAYLIDLYAIASRPGRVLPDLIDPMPLPRAASSVNIPRLTQGTLVDVQATQNTTLPYQDVTDAQLTARSTTLAGFLDVSLQLLEQAQAPGLDELIMRDLFASLDASLEAQLISGSANITGLLNVSGVNSVTYTAATPAGLGLHSAMAQAYAQISNTRSRPPEAWLMRGSRFAWLGSQADTSGRPFLTPAGSNGSSAESSPTSIGTVLGVPVFAQAALPANLGTGTNQDVVIGFRPDDLFLFESEPQLMIADDPLGSTLGARIRIHTYTAAIMGLYPSSIATVSGTGLVVGSGY